MQKMSAAISDIMVMTRRNVIRYIRLPQLLVFNAMLNVVLLLLFNYVFGGAIQKSGIPYIQYFLPGFLANGCFWFHSDQRRYRRRSIERSD